MGETIHQESLAAISHGVNALVFLYREVLHRPFDELERVERPLRRPKVPVVLSQPEVTRLLESMEGTPGLIARLLYGTGLRLMEGLRLRVKDVDFGRNQIIVHDGKGFKDRRVDKRCTRLRFTLARQGSRASGSKVRWMDETKCVTRGKGAGRGGNGPKDTFLRF